MIHFVFEVCEDTWDLLKTPPGFRSALLFSCFLVMLAPSVLYENQLLSRLSETRPSLAYRWTLLGFFLHLVLFGGAISLIGVPTLRSFERSDEDNRSGTEEGILSDILQGALGTVIVFLGVYVGLFLLLLPGILFLACSFFFLVFIALREEHFITAIQSSWNLSRGKRWHVVGLILVLGGVYCLLAFFSAGFVIVMQSVGIFEVPGTDPAFLRWESIGTWLPMVILTSLTGGIMYAIGLAMSYAGYQSLRWSGEANGTGRESASGYIS